MKNYKNNRLLFEKSPYLLQHAYNPVDWYPWGQEAFETAKREDKPIFLSIGYATCHFCHLMEQESFQSQEIAKMMNETFINIKVDREELPEVDSLYMEFALKLMPGATGWPLNLVLTPDLEPFFAVTYLPPQEMGGLMGLKELIIKINYMWNGEERETLIEEAHQLVHLLKKNIEVKGSQISEKEVIDESAELLFKMADQIYGGIKGFPKFPIGYHLNFMLRYFLISKDSRAGFLVDRSLDMMHRGGIFDHLGGGFSRYSTDEEWLIPHFEKMLYDNALLSFAYLESWQMRKKKNDLEICKEILDYVLVDMKSSDGGFYSAEDADSEKLEGRFYTWDFEELEDILGSKEGKLLLEYFGASEKGNFYGRNVLHTPLNLDEFAEQKGVSFKELKETFKAQKEKLLNVRNKRPHPFKDDKILSSWNGLMIHALIEAGSAFSENRYLEAALEAAWFIQEKMWQDGKLFRRFREGDLKYKGSLDEYAFLIRGYLSLFEANLGLYWLKEALKMTHFVEQNFKLEGGAYYQTDGSDPYLILRKCRFSDGAEPSGNAIHCENLLRLYRLTEKAEFLENAEEILAALKNQLENYPPGYVYHLMNLNRYYDHHAPTFVIALDEQQSLETELKEYIYSKFMPHKTLIWKKRQEESEISSLIPFIKNCLPIENKTTLYLFLDEEMQKPLNEWEKMEEAIKNI